MKKLVSLLLIIAMLTSLLAACDTSEKKPEESDSETRSETDSETETELQTETDTEAETEPETDEKVSLNGKKVLFIGNSQTFYGNCVIQKSQSYMTQESRQNDQGYFYQLCKSNGAEVQVTNWTFGNHNLGDFLGPCNAQRVCQGEYHMNYLTDRNFDYVIIQQSGQDSIDLMLCFQQCTALVEMFREANPNVQLLFLVHRRAYELDLDWLVALPSLADMGIRIVNYGKMIEDIIAGSVTVLGASLTYNQNSFIVKQSAKDGYHPNILTGYLTALATYCAITGESAVGQDYSFCNNSSLHSKFNFDSFINTYYGYQGSTTNFKEIFASPSEMYALQALLDTYLADSSYGG